MFTLMMQAHEKDITFNEHMENIVRAACDEALVDPEAYRRKMSFNELPEDHFDDDEEMRDEYDFSNATSGSVAAMKTKKKKKK